MLEAGIVAIGEPKYWKYFLASKVIDFPIFRFIFSKSRSRSNASSKLSSVGLKGASGASTTAGISGKCPAKIERTMLNMLSYESCVTSCTHYTTIIMRSVFPQSKRLRTISTKKKMEQQNRLKSRFENNDTSRRHILTWMDIIASSTSYCTPHATSSLGQLGVEASNNLSTPSAFVGGCESEFAVEGGTRGIAALPPCRHNADTPVYKASRKTCRHYEKVTWGTSSKKTDAKMGETIQAAERVRVVVRVRPPNDRELQQNSYHHALTVDDEGAQIFVSKKKSENECDRELRYTYDRVFGATSQQTEIFDYLRDGVQQVAQGFNCTVFAYGQTGTGKTHTMLGQDLESHLSTTCSSPDAPECSPSWGVIPRTIESLFEELQSISQHGSAGVVHCSYMQIYKNDVYDLLQDNKDRMKDPLAVREMIKGNGKQIYVSGLSEFRVTSLHETLQLLKTGNRNRTIRATAYNEKSSRSHALLQLSIEVESRGLESATTIIRRAKLNLVDLAGSEKWDTDVVAGSDRSKELTSINQSLSALGNVISALVNPKRTHIPYRDSKLTRLLQDSLGGNTRTVVIATISPSASAIDETISTLQFADRAKCVTVRVKVNELVDDAILLAQAQREISRLKLLLKQSGSHQQLSALEEQVTRLNKEKAALTAENQKLRRTVANLRKATSGVSTGYEGNKITSKSRDKAAMSYPSPPSLRNSALAIDNQQSSSLQLDQLRLDLRALGGGDSRTKPTVFNAFSLENTDNERFEQAAKEQELILQEIQTERRELERQLDLLSGNQSGDLSIGGDSIRSEDPCPVCGNDIDDHNDAELDRCIELEAKMINQQRSAITDKNLPERKKNLERPTTQSEKVTSAPSSGHRTKTPRSAASDPRLRRVSSSAHGKSSPYISAPVRKPSTPPQTKVNCSSERQPKEAFSAETNDQSTKTSVSNNQADNEPSQIPILRQGHKGLKALKKFRATSPYNNAVPQKEKRTTPQTVKQTDSKENGRSIANSVRDIGLELSVYKFRYDCWYNCTIVGFDRKRRMHCCQYDCGDKQWQDLSGHKVKVLGRPDDSS